MATALDPHHAEPLDKQAPGRGATVIVYMLLLGSVMTVVTAPAGALVAHLKYRHAAPWVQSHLQFQLRTFWLGVLGGALFAVVWQLLGVAGISPMAPWAMGYVFFYHLPDLAGRPLRRRHFPANRQSARA